MKNIIFLILKCVGFIAMLGIFSGCATTSDKKPQYSREPIFIDAKDRQGCKIAHFFNQDDDEKPLEAKIAIASNAEIAWDGECEEGYANGMGAEITQNENGAKYAIIAVYTERIPRYAYFYQSNGDKYALFMGAFGDILDHIENDYKYGLSVENNGKKLRLRNLRADIVFDTTYSDDRRLSVNGYELRDILLDPQKAEHKHALRLIKDYKGDLAQSIANYRESLSIAQQYSDKICGESSGESAIDLVEDSANDSSSDSANVGADSSVDSANHNADSGVDSSVDSGANLSADSGVDSSAIHHYEICALKINYTAEVEIMQKLIEFLGEL